MWPLLAVALVVAQAGKPAPLANLFDLPEEMYRRVLARRLEQTLGLLAGAAAGGLALLATLGFFFFGPGEEAAPLFEHLRRLRNCLAIALGIPLLAAIPVAFWLSQPRMVGSVVAGYLLGFCLAGWLRDLESSQEPAAGGDDASASG